MTPLNKTVERLGNKLVALKYYLSVAESCTGGWIAQELTAVSGSSKWFDRGFVTYSNEAKQELLGVPSAMIKEHGAVSEEVVKAMAEGMVKHSQAQVSISVSGIAGPKSGRTTKPVGTVWFGWVIPGQGVLAEHHLFPGDRQAVRQQAAEYAIARLEELLP